MLDCPVRTKTFTGWEAAKAGKTHVTMKPIRIARIFDFMYVSFKIAQSRIGALRPLSSDISI